ncbi:MAG: substrate-binding domain-containing protein [Blastocatellia bacterium]|nr:substrate-binding domain-containing protein [Blastocatellia bacterium]MBN8722164.1 substrate-binding domain-containing protein [Acidobacteriota bacterium]
MSTSNKKDKLDDPIKDDSLKDDPLETSFISNITIDVSASPDGKTRSNKENLSSGRTSTNRESLSTAQRASARTTTLALDPRPYKKRERVYTTIIIILSSVILAQALLLWLAYFGNNVNDKQLIITGAKVNQSLLIELTEAFMTKNLGMAISVMPKSERVALAELTQGKAHLVQTTFQLSQEERKQLTLLTGREVKEILAPKWALAFYVHKDNPIDALTLIQLQSIFKGEVNNWQAFGGMDSAIGIQAFYDNHFINEFIQKRIINNPQTKVSPKIISTVIDNPSNIAYGEVKEILPSNVKLLKIKVSDIEEGKLPILEGKLNKDYPLAYNTYWYTTDLSKDLADFLRQEVEKQ